MAELVDPTKIEDIVGMRRDVTRHYARAVSSEEMIYILHSHQCVQAETDLRECPYSVALDKGLTAMVQEHPDRPLRVRINSLGMLVPLLEEDEKDG